MTWTLTEDLEAFMAAAGGFLRSRPVQNTIQLTETDKLTAAGSSGYSSEAPLFGWWRSVPGPAADQGGEGGDGAGNGAAGGTVECALLHTPPYPVLLTRLSAGSARPLAAELFERGRQLAGVNAEQGDAAEFAAAWVSLAGARAQEFRRSRLFRLGQLTPAAPPPRGAARVASGADTDLLEAWFAACTREIGDMAGPVSGAVDDYLSYGGLTLWEVDGTAVSMAGVKRPAAGVVRVGPVYTPADQRRRGYAGAVTAAVSQAVLDAGAQHVVLFTDLANPTSNALYQRIGFRPVADRVVLSFVG